MLSPVRFQIWVTVFLDFNKISLLCKVFLWVLLFSSTYPKISQQADWLEKGFVRLCMCFWDMLQIHCGSDQDKVFTEHE